MFCVNCGARLPEGAKFCLECGWKVGEIEGKKNNPDERASGIKFVAAVCTNCGAALQVDPNLQAAICPFCGTPYIVEKAIQNSTVINNYVMKGPEAENFLVLSEHAMKAGKYSEAAVYADRALEQDPKNIDAWICKILVAGYDIDGDRSSEISSYIESALEKITNDEDEIKIYSAVMDVAGAHIEEATKLLGSNIERIQKQLRDKRNKNDIAAMDSGYIANLTRILNEAVEYRNLIPHSIVVRSPKLQEKACELSKIYIRYYEALVQRLNLYGASISQKIKNRKRDNLERILDGTKGNAPDDIQTVERSTKKKGLFGALFS